MWIVLLSTPKFKKTFKVKGGTCFTLYEVLSIHDMLEELERVCEKYETEKESILS